MPSMAACMIVTCCTFCSVVLLAQLGDKCPRPARRRLIPAGRAGQLGLTMDELELNNIETQSQELLWHLIANVPSDLGEMARAIVGGSQAATGRPADGGKPAALSPANPLPWTSSVLALCCRAYDQPTE